MPPSTTPEQAQRFAAYILGLSWMDPNKATADGKGGVLLWGPPGTGKTSAALVVGLAWAKAGHSAAFQDFGELMVQVRSAWRKDAAETVDQIHARMLKPKLLILDDIAKRETPEDADTLSLLVNARINAGKKTICTTNSDLSTEDGVQAFLRAVDARVFERFADQYVHCQGKNLRREK